MRRDFDKLSTIGGFGAILLWSVTFAFSRSLSEEIGPLTAGATAYLIGGCFCLVWHAWQGRGMSDFLQLPRLYVVGCGALFVFYTAALYYAVGLAKTREQVLEVALINYLWPSLTVLFSLLLLKKRATFWLVPGTLLALTGIVLVMTGGERLSWDSFAARLQSNPAAYGLSLAAAFSWALYSNLTRRWSGVGNEGAVVLFVSATGLVLLALRLATTEPADWSLKAVGEVSCLATITTLSYALWDCAMRKGNLLLVAACSYFTPLLSTLVSCIYLQVSPGPRLWIGCLLLVSGSLVTWRSVSDRDPSEDS